MASTSSAPELPPPPLIRRPESEAAIPPKDPNEDVERFIPRTSQRPTRRTQRRIIRRRGGSKKKKRVSRRVKY